MSVLKNGRRIIMIQNIKPCAQFPLHLISKLLVLCLIVGVFVLPASAVAQVNTVAETLGPKACADCHKLSFKAWKGSQHFKTFKALPKKSEAKAIAKKMGIKRIKKGSECLTCHFTEKPRKNKTKVVAGISCESCHGAGKNWIDIHSDFGGQGIKAAEESAEHKVERYANAEKAGMIRPSNIYNVAKNCYGCHTVPNEKLVNVGGHKSGSPIELVQWSQGEVRHNVWYSEVNNASPVERLRLMFIIGKALDLEYALRGIAKATEEQTYFTEMLSRQKSALTAVKAVAEAISNAEYSAIAAVVNDADIKINNEAALLQAADKISAIAMGIAKKYNGSEFGGIDAMLPAADSYKGSVFTP